VVLVGLGPAKSEVKDTEKAAEPDISGQKIGESIAKGLVGEKGAKTATIVMPASFETNYGDVSSSFYSQLYCDIRFKGLKSNSKLPAEDLTTVNLFVEGGSDATDAELKAGASLAKGIYMTKDIVNAPHNFLNSLSLSNTAKRIAKESGGSISCQIMGKKEIEARGMGAFLAVARGSETDPYLIHLTYKPKSGVVK
jgi:leucyl aminopeptidase